MTNRWVGLAVLLTANFLAVLTSTIVAIAVPTIQVELGLSASLAVWVLGAYALAYGVVLIPGGKLGDIVGRRTIFVAGMATFTAGGVVAATAGNGWLLIAGTAIQGCAAGLAVPQVLGTIPSVFPAEQRGRAFGLYGVATGLGAAVGPLLGGVLLTADLYGSSWRGVFLVSVPIGLAVAIAGRIVLPPPVRSAGSIDVVGAVLLAAGLLLVLVPLTESQEDGWSAWVVAPLILAIPMLAAFARQQRRRVAAGRVPLLNPALMRERSFTASLVIGLAYFAAFQALLYTTSAYLQAGRSATALVAGLALAPFALVSVIVSLYSDRATRRLGPAVVGVGAALVIAGLAVALVVTRIGEDVVLLAAGLAVVGIGHGLIVPPNVSLGLRDVPPTRAGGAGGAINTAQRIGQSLGVAVIGGAFLAAAAASGYRTALTVGIVAELVAAAVALAASFFIPRSPTRH